jgi:hypothetical protein
MGSLLNYQLLAVVLAVVLVLQGCTSQNRADQGDVSCPHDDGSFIGVCREGPPEKPPGIPHGDHGERI